MRNHFVENLRNLFKKYYVVRTLFPLSSHVCCHFVINKVSVLIVKIHSGALFIHGFQSHCDHILSSFARLR